MPMHPDAAALRPGEAAAAVHRAARTNPVLADALAKLPRYVEAQAQHAHLVEQMTKVPDPPQDADLAAQVRELVEQRRRLPRNLVGQVAEARAAREAYGATRTILSQLVGTLTQERDAAVIRDADTALSHLRGVLSTTMKALTRLHSLPPSALEAMNAGKADAWHERQQHVQTLEHVRAAQRVVTAAAMGSGGTGLPDHIGRRWEHVAFTPRVERFWSDQADLAHYLARGHRRDSRGNVVRIRQPYPGDQDHRAWAVYLIEHDAPAWLPSLEELEQRADELRALAATATTDQATRHMGTPTRIA